MIAGGYAAFVSLWQAGSSAPDVRAAHRSFYGISRRFGVINVEVTFRQTNGLLQSRRAVERCYLLRGRDAFDSGNLIGFLRQYGPVYGQRFVIYKPYNDPFAYLVGTTDGVVPKKKQFVCFREFRAENFPGFFDLLIGGADQIEVERIRFPYRRPHIRAELEH